MAWLPGYAYRKPLVLTGGASGAQTDFQLDIDIAYVAAKMQADFDDIRFTQNNGTTLVDAWLESKVDSASAETWAEFPSTPANTVEQTYYMYYGKAGAVNYWDIDATFIFGDDFPGTSLDTTKWDKTDAGVTATVSGGLLSLNWGGSGYHGITSKSAYSFPAVCTLKGYVNNNVNYMETGFTDAHHSSPLVVFNGKFYDDLGGTLYTNDVCYTTSTTYIWDLFRTTTDSEAFQDGISKWVQSPGNTDDVHKVGCLDHGNSARLYYIFVRKYAANPPTYAFGAEESAPTGAAPTSVFYGPFGGPLGGPI